MQPKLTEKSIRYIIRQLKKGRGTKIVAEEMNVAQRHVQRLWESYRKTGTIPVLRQDDPRNLNRPMTWFRRYWMHAAADQKECSGRPEDYNGTDII